MAILKFFGAESATIEETGGSIPAGYSVDTVVSPNAAGARSYKNDGTGTTNLNFAGGIDTSGLYWSHRFRISYSGTPGSAIYYRLGSVYDASSNGLAWILLRHNATGSNSFSLYFVNGSTAQIVGNTYNFTYTPGDWIDFEAYISASSAWAKLDGTQVCSASGSNVLWTSGTNINFLSFFSVSVSDNTRPFWVDDIIVSNTSIGGNPSVIARQFYNTGAYNAWTVNSGTKAAAVSQTPYSAANYVYSAVNSSKQTFLVNSFSSTETGKGVGYIASGGTVLAAKMGAVLKSSSSATNGVDFIRRYNSSDNLDVGFTISTSDAYYDQCGFNNTQYRAHFPSLAELNGTEYGINHYYTNSYTQYLEDMWVHAVYWHGADFALAVTESATKDTLAASVFIGPTKTALAAIAGSGAALGLAARLTLRAAVITSAGSVAADGVRLTNTFLRPDSDVALNGWSAINAGSLYAALDEITPDDTDYIRSPDPAGGIACEVGLSGGDITAPVGFWYRASKYGSAVLTLTIKVMEGTTERAVRTRVLTDAFVTYQETLTPAEVAAVTDWANVTIRFSAA